MFNRINKKQRKLGNTEKALIIKLLKRSDNYYDIVLTRRKTKPTSRLCRFGYYQIVRNFREDYSILSLDFNRVSTYLINGVAIDSSFAKIILN